MMIEQQTKQLEKQAKVKEAGKKAYEKTNVNKNEADKMLEKLSKKH